MMKKRKAIVSLLVCCCLLFGVAGCGDEEPTNAVQLAYDTGIQGNHYNTEIFGRNDTVTWGADPGGIYVSKEQSEEYGGYYYAYITGTSAGYYGNYNIGYLTPEDKAAGIVGAAIRCYRSKDLFTWEPAGVKMDGFSVACYETDWEAWKENGNCWAPEVIYDGGKYYMFYNMVAKKSTSAEVTKGGYYVGVAVSDTPVGPFVSVQKDDNGVNVPPINFEAHFGFDGHMPVIDISPFIDPNGEGKRYIYFKTEVSNDAVTNALDNGCHFYCMEMENWTTPKYDSIKLVLAPNAVSVTTDDGAEAALKLQGKQETGTIDDVTDHYVMEGPQCIERDGKYYLTYSVNGYTDPSYSVWQAVGNSPMGPFVKTAKEQGNPIISGRELGYANGSGHHAFIDDGNEVYAVYHVHGNQTSLESSPGRFLFADRVHFTENGIVVNGPSNYLQWLPESVSGYKNLARSAKVSTDGGKGKEYLSDEIIPVYTYNAGWVYSKDGDVSVTFTFDKAVSVRAIMVYNSPKIETAFSKIDAIEFALAEKAAFMSRDYGKAVIYNLAYPKMYLSETDEYAYNPCAPAVADFTPIKVNSVTVKISGGSKLLHENRDGTANNSIDITEIVILGV